MGQEHKRIHVYPCASSEYIKGTFQLKKEQFKAAESERNRGGNQTEGIVGGSEQEHSKRLHALDPNFKSKME